MIPGLRLAERGSQRWWTLAGAPGLLIPVRDFQARIVALKVRADDPGERPKYTTVSSAKHGGPSPGAQVHVPRHDGPRSDTVRLTEGELKADVATALSSVLTIAVPGVSMWRKALPVLQSLQAQRVLLAFDSDWRTNPYVAQALAQAACALVKAGYEVQVEDWEAPQGKGIDDLLAAGHRPRLCTAALALGAIVRERARPYFAQVRTISSEEVRPWHA